jgi:hypothetical protein
MGGLGLAVGRWEVGGGRWGICKLVLWGQNETHAVQLGIWVQNQHLFWDWGKPRNSLSQLDGHRTFLMQYSFQPTVRPSSTRYLAEVPKGLPAVFLKIHDYEDWCLYKLFLKFESLHHTEHSPHHKDERLYLFKKKIVCVFIESYKMHKRSLCENAKFLTITKWGTYNYQ